jgi:hypothetical protein
MNTLMNISNCVNISKFLSLQTYYQLVKESYAP